MGWGRAGVVTGVPGRARAGTWGGVGQGWSHGVGQGWSHGVG